MLTAKKLYTFNETIVTTGAAVITGTTDEEFNASLEAIIADESNYITVAINGVTSYLLPLCGTQDGDLSFFVYSVPTKPMDFNNPEGAEIMHYAINGSTLYSMAGLVCEIADMGGMAEWVLANTTTSGLTIPIESPSGVKLLLTGKVGTEDISVIPKLLEQGSVTPTTGTQTISVPEGYAGIKSFTVNKIPSDYVIPSGSVTITRNGTYGVWGKSEAIVDVSVTTEEKTVTPTKETQEVTPSTGAYLSKVTVDKIPDEYIIPEEYEGEVIIDG